MINSDNLKYIQILWDFMRMDQKVEKSDCMVVLGCSDIKVVNIEIEHRKEAKDRIQDKNNIEYNPLTIIHSNKESVEKTMDNKLIACLTNIKNGTRSFIEGDCYEIGTDIENDLCLTGKFISRNHAKIIVENGKYYLIDCNSKNGTFINSVRIPVGNPVEIFNNSEIYFADECFIFTVER